MRLSLEIEPGSVVPRSVPIEAGMELRVGRMAPAHVILNDATVSRQHFEISYDGRTARIRDLGSTHGTTVNGQPVTAAIIRDGDTIKAGMSTLRVRLVREDVRLAPAPDADPPEAPPIGMGTADMPVMAMSLHDQVIRTLRAQKGTLYAILDAARHPLVLARVLQYKEERQSLYEGTKGDKLMAFAPYLVILPKNSDFLETLVKEGWGKSWGVYLTSDRPFAEVRKHLRHFLMVDLAGEQVYFRFYDPRVLRVFLPTCTPKEAIDFLGPIQRYLLEGDSAEEMKVATADRGRLHIETRALVSDHEVTATAK